MRINSLKSITLKRIFLSQRMLKFPFRPKSCSNQCLHTIQLKELLGKNYFRWRRNICTKNSHNLQYTDFIDFIHGLFYLFRPNRMVFTFDNYGFNYSANEFQFDQLIRFIIIWTNILFYSGKMSALKNPYLSNDT